MKQITKGSWKSTAQGIESEEGLLIAQAWCGHSNNSFGNIPAVSYLEMNANSQLIAAAPDLLKACEAFIELFKESYMRPEDKCDELYDKMLLAIKKATK